MKENESTIRTREMDNNTQIEEEPKESKCNKKKLIVIIIIIFLLIIIFMIIVLFVLQNYREISSVREKSLTKEEISIAKYNTVIKLNQINFPTSKSNYSYDEEHLNKYYNFTHNFFQNLNYTDFSPISLYSILINIYMAISDTELSELLNKILGLNNEELILFYSQIFKNNYFKNADGEIMISNGAFYNSDRVKENPSFVNQMTKTFTECYKLSYNKDFNFIQEWINKSLKEKKESSKENINNKNEIGILFYSNLYYNQKWKTKFVDEKSYNDFFYIDNENKKEINFLKHSYYVDNYFDYDKYISFYDYYNNHYSIQYIVPKSINDNILNLVNNINFIYENETNKKNETYITLSVPKFKIDNEIDFIPILKDMGFEKLFNKKYSTLNNPFTIENNYNYYLEQLIQKNKVELNEDGTIIKIKTVASVMPMSASPYDRGIEVKLNQPFIFIIRDINKLPIFIGHIKDPNF